MTGTFFSCWLIHKFYTVCIDVQSLFWSFIGGKAEKRGRTLFSPLWWAACVHRNIWKSCWLPSENGTGYPRSFKISLTGIVFPSIAYVVMVFCFQIRI